ncbi:calcium ion binding [Desmophyllum pertusum]|uniref:Calcium ion binding n=1 Tax=Desmophyllum pertusum TaxID=174260 RepID=A0A9W9Z139_9CNID|nr:calcium ion binding [Desmophyllum pertusum]
MPTLCSLVSKKQNVRKQLIPSLMRVTDFTERVLNEFVSVKYGLAPNVTITCPTRAVKLDARTEIVCRVLSRTFAKITWFHNGQPISDQRQSHVTVDSLTCNQTLKIKFAKTIDGGNYTCQVTNSNVTVKQTCSIEVKADKTKEIHIEYLKIAGHRQTALLQGSVELECNMLHVEIPVWRRDNMNIKNERHIWRTEYTFGRRGMMFYLRIINVTKNDEGLYMCLGYKHGIWANKTLYLKTEPCPRGHFCPYKENRAIPCPLATGTSANNRVIEEMKNCFSKEGTPESPAARSRGSSSCNPEYTLIFMYTLMWISGVYPLVV